MIDWLDRIGAYLPPAVRDSLARVPREAIEAATDLRLRADRPAMLCGAQPAQQLPVVPAADLRAVSDAMLGHAAHARQEELRQGFVTLPGGFRAGFCGRAVVRDGALSSLQDIASVTIRIAREVPGVAEPMLHWCLDGERLRSVLLVSPPGLGKTTMLRDVARLLSERGFAVAMVDERSEMAACDHGVPTLDVGPCTDVLDGCPKAEGMRLLLRAMAPQLIITDELGRPEDTAAVCEAARCGIAVIASAHGQSYEGLEARPMTREMMRSQVFERVLTLAAPGRIGAVYGAGGNQLA